MATTAVSFRKGNTEENNNFAGVPGEIVADLGANEQITENATIVLHTGNGLAGGIRMARQDLNNITNESISNLANFRQDSGQGTYYGLLRRNMSNYITNDVNPSTVEGLLKSDYHIASQDGHDLDTSSYIAGDSSWGNQGPIVRSAGGKYLMNRDLSNMHADGENKVRKLSYQYWLNNVNTKFLAEGNYPDPFSPDPQNPQIVSPQGDLLAYANMSNVDTGVLAGDSGTHIGADLAYKDLSNVNYSNVVNKINTAYGEDVKLDGYEDTINKKSVIDPLAPSQEMAATYPTIQAVVDYGAVLTEDFVNKNLDNVANWQIASEKQDLWKIEFSIIDPGNGYTLPCTIRTNIAHPDGGTINIVVTNIDENGGILAARPEIGKEYSHGAIASQTINDNDPDWRKGGIFSLSTVNVNAGKLMRANLSNSDIKNSLATQTAAVKYEFTEDPNNTGAIVSVDSVFSELTDTSNQVSPTAGIISVNRELGGVESKLSVQDILDPNAITTSSITVTKNNAYLNKSAATESQDANHQLLNRGEMDARFQFLPATATQDNIAVFNAAKSTVDSGKCFTTNVANAVATTSDNKIPTEHAVREAIEEAVTRAVVYKGTVNSENDLPSSGQTNGDLYWIRAFSNNPPAGMIAGHSGTAIWNANLATPAWDFKEDAKNDPDGSTLELNSSGKMKVRIASDLDNAISVNSTGLYVSADRFVPSQDYVAVAAVSGQSGKVLTNNGTNTSWRTATPEPPTTQGIYHLSVDANGVATWVNDNRLSLGPVTE